MKQTREQWLVEAVYALRPLFGKHGFTVPKAIRVSVGFPLGARKAIGQMWHPAMSADETNEIFISPVLADPLEVLDVLVHEMVHAVMGPNVGHKAAFKRCAVAVGLEGKMTATVAGKELLVKLNTISTRLGTYPHAELTPMMDKKQTTRLIKLQCLDCGMPLRVTQKWIDLYPTPWACPCGGELVSEEDTE